LTTATCLSCLGRQVSGKNSGSQLATRNSQLKKTTMDIEAFRDYCLSKKGTDESFPFDEKTLVFKVMGKMFALAGLEASPSSANLKCDPERAIELREEYPEDIRPGYHMNKKHWNTVIIEGELSDEFIIELVDHSYDLVVSKLRKVDKEVLKNL
jgi:predicted DNA-binding protein (MmcQ/YjbR family)